MNRVHKKRLINSYVFFCFLVICVAVVIIPENIRGMSGLALVTFMINGIIMIFNLMKKSKLGYSSEDTFWIFMLFFMCLAPFVEVARWKFPWWNTNLITNKLIIQSNIYILIFILIFIVTKKITTFKVEKNIKYIENLEIIINISFYISLVICIFIIYKTGFLNLLSRGTNNIQGIGQVTWLILNNSLSVFPIITILLNINYKGIYGKYYSRSKFILILILGIIVNFPTGIPRFKMAVIYLSIFVTFKNKFKNKYIFKIMVILGLIYIFPLINIFRDNTFSNVINLQINMPDLNQQFITGNYDSYSMLVRSILYIQDEGITFGRQLLGNVLFFIPRSIWETKPIGSGAMIAKFFGWQFTNISCPYIGEGLLNFGIVGIVIFAIILAILLKKSTIKYEYVIMNKSRKIGVIELIYPFSIGFVFFIMRGDLLSSLSYLIGFIVPVIFLYIIDRLLSIYSR